MRCCSNCFGDTFLSRQIENVGEYKGNCYYCDANDVTLITPIKLQDYFELLLGIYCEDKDGKTLVELLKSDWSLFYNLDNAHCKDLLSEILDDGEAVRKRYRPSISDDGSSLDRWQGFRAELKNENRFFPKNTPNLERLGELLEGHLCSDLVTIPDILYRARIVEGDSPHPADKMGKPPRELSTHGRANPAGIPYLYLASDVDTAIAEIRPHTGENVCVAEFKVVAKPKLVDLRDPRKTISPFSLSDEKNIAQLRNDIDFLCQLGEELTRPVLPKKAYLEYLPSQYLCEFIKRSGFDGVMYRSSVGDGINYAMFDETLTKVEAVRVYAVTGVNVNSKEIT